MTEINSDTIHATLRELEVVVEQAGASLIQAEAHHRAQLRRSVETGDFSLSVASETALAEARVAHDRAKTSLAVAGQLLAEAVKRERAAAQALVRAEVEAELADIAEVAHTLDTRFAEFVGQLVRLREREAALHRRVRDHFRSPWTAPQILTSARSLSAFLMSLANGYPQDIKGWISQSVVSASHSIKAAFHD